MKHTLIELTPHAPALIYIEHDHAVMHILDATKHHYDLQIPYQSNAILSRLEDVKTLSFSRLSYADKQIYNELTNRKELISKPKMIQLIKEYTKCLKH